MTIGGPYSEAQAPPLPTSQRWTLIAAQRWLESLNRHSREGLVERSLSLHAPEWFEEPRTELSHC